MDEISSSPVLYNPGRPDSESERERNIDPTKMHSMLGKPRESNNDTCPVRHETEKDRCAETDDK